MTASQLLQALTQITYVVIFLVVAVEAARRPRRATIDTALLFGATTIVIMIGWLTATLRLPASPALGVLNGALVMALPYLLLRLVDDFATVPPRVLRGAAAGLALAVAGLAAIPPPLPVWLVSLYVAYFAGLEGYAAVMFVLAARRSSGVTRRRMQAVAAGSLCLGLTIALAGVQTALPPPETWAQVASQLAGLASGLFYFLGFAPPAWVRRAWQEPELRAFLGRAARLPRLPDTDSIVRELELGAAASLGAPQAVIGLWRPDENVLRYQTANGVLLDLAPGQLIGGWAFTAQRPLFSEHAARDDPDHAEFYQRGGANAILAAPITAGATRLGVLCVFAPRAPIFATDDLALVTLLADQAAVILESRVLLDEAARVRAREEATRIKDDFLSAAAHDLKTPLTAMLAQAQLMERTALRQPEAPADLRGIRRLIGETQRLTRLVTDLLDVSRVERGQLVGPREPVDLVALAREVCDRHGTPRHPCRIEATEAVVAAVDRARVSQLLDNLVENAVKYSPAGGEVRVTVRRERDQALLAVTDQGIGIPASDLTHLFERFHRGANVDDRRFVGLGLGLFICKAIAEQHGGRIWATSPGPGRGSTFHVLLPVSEAAAVTAEAETMPGPGT
jgi:signal transduction histidine kinase